MAIYERKALERFVAKEKATPRQRRPLKESLLIRKQKYRELKKKEKEKKEKDGRESQDKMETRKRIIKPRDEKDKIISDLNIRISGLLPKKKDEELVSEDSESEVECRKTFVGPDVTQN